MGNDVVAVESFFLFRVFSVASVVHLFTFDSLLFPGEALFSMLRKNLHQLQRSLEV